MNTRILFPLLFTVASFSASAGNWAVKNGWCQTMTEDGQALVMLKNGTIGITGLMQERPNGVQTLLGSRISINGNLIPTSQMCNQQTGFRAVEVEVGQAPEMVKKAVHSIAERDVSVLQAFGVRMEFTRGDMLKVCPKFVTSLAGFSRNRHPPLIKIPSCRLPGRHTPGNMTRKQQKPLILALTK